VMSETREVDGRRVWWREWVKARIVGRFHGALCGGESHRRYLVRLGMRPEAIALGYNVVDNGFFAGMRNAKWGMRNGGGLVNGPYFLASNRFVERKNLARLVCAYALYGRRSAGAVWPLVMLGDGEMRRLLEELCGELGVAAGSGTGRGEVVFAGFRQIGELPDFYAGAGAFVHPALEEPWGLVINEAMASGLPVVSSRNVGAAEELVVEGETGFLFDPEDVERLAGLLGRVAGMSDAQRAVMGRAAREMVERKAPKRAFGEGLAKVLAR
jgi:glycosyltransferase involved in cell wall biosynthesis